MLSTRRSRYLGAFAVATVVAAAGQETSPNVSVEADSVFFECRLLFPMKRTEPQHNRRTVLT